MDLDGYAVGGLAVGESHEEMYHILDVIVPSSATGKANVSDGCRNPGQHSGSSRSWCGLLRLCISEPKRPSRTCIHKPGQDETCSMPNMNWISVRSKKDVSVRPAEITAAAYIRHLLKAKEMLGMRLCVLHNLYFYNTMMSEIRQAIEEGRYKEYKKQKLEGFLENDKK